MRQRIGLLLVAALMLPLTSCDALSGFLVPTTVTVLLVNNSPDYSVDVSLFYDDEDDLPEILLTEIGTQMELTVLAGQIGSFVRDCDDLQAIVVDDADLLVFGGLGPEANSDVLRIDDEFECGDQIVFEFTHSDVVLDFDVAATVQTPGWLKSRPE
jgi:hypothetical protein